MSGVLIRRHFSDYFGGGGKFFGGKIFWVKFKNFKVIVGEKYVGRKILGGIFRKKVWGRNKNIQIFLIPLFKLSFSHIPTLLVVLL